MECEIYTSYEMSPKHEANHAVFLFTIVTSVLFLTETNIHSCVPLLKTSFIWWKVFWLVLSNPGTTTSLMRTCRWPCTALPAACPMDSTVCWNHKHIQSAHWNAFFICISSHMQNKGSPNVYVCVCNNTKLQNIFISYTKFRFWIYHRSIRLINKSP